MVSLELAKEFVSLYNKHRIGERAAALSYYALISLAPLLVLLLALSSFFLGNELVKTEIIFQVQDTFGDKIANVIQSFLTSITRVESQITYSVVGIILLVYGATHLFAHIHTSLKDIFEVEVTSSLAKSFLRKHTVALIYIFISFCGVVGLSLANILSSILLDMLPLDMFKENQFIIFQLLGLGITVIVVSLLIALTYRYSGSKNLAWLDAFSGAVIASLIMALLGLLFNIYIHYSVILSAYGASLFVVALLLWAYYASQAVLIGAIVSKIVARRSHH